MIEREEHDRGRRMRDQAPFSSRFLAVVILLMIAVLAAYEYQSHLGSVSSSRAECSRNQDALSGYSPSELIVSYMGGHQGHQVSSGGGAARTAKDVTASSRKQVAKVQPNRRLPSIRIFKSCKVALKHLANTLVELLHGLGHVLGIRRRRSRTQPPQLTGGKGRLVKPFYIHRIDLNDLSEDQRSTVEGDYADLRRDAAVVRRGKAVGMSMDADCVARYHIAAQWKPKGGRTVPEHIASTVRWREEQQLHDVKIAPILSQAENGYLYVNGTDLLDRPIIYFHAAYQNSEKPERAVKYLIYTLERALQEARRRKVEAYSFVIDCSDFSFHNIPPIALIKQVFSLLHHHYPTRVGFILFLYTGAAFQMLWRMLAPLVSPMTRDKIIFAASGHEEEELLARISPQELLDRYGGTRSFEWSTRKYFGLRER